MLIKKFNTIEELSEFAAKTFIERANQAIIERGRFLVSLSGGSTPMKLYERLANEKLDWGRVHFFWGDERCVPANDPGNTYGQTKKILFDKIGTTNIHRVESDLEPESAAESYAHTLSRFADAPFDFPRFDLVLLGMGDDGHTASLFPGSPVDIETPTLAVTAQYQDRPAKRVSLTPKVFNQSREIWFLVSGASKAEATRLVIHGDRNLEQLPAQRIQPANGNLVWMMDKAAGKFL
jgi:6-phosphogluconolactonase